MFTYDESEIILDYHQLNWLAGKGNMSNGWKADMFPFETNWFKYNIIHYTTACQFHVLLSEL